MDNSNMTRFFFPIKSTDTSGATISDINTATMITAE